jgi:hypothetical protein
MDAHLRELACWTIFGIHTADPRLIALGLTGVTASTLMPSRIQRTSRYQHHSITQRVRSDCASPVDLDALGDPGHLVSFRGAVIVRGGKAYVLWVNDGPASRNGLFATTQRRKQTRR